MKAITGRMDGGEGEGRGGAVTEQGCRRPGRRPKQQSRQEMKSETEAVGWNGQK